MLSRLFPRSLTNVYQGSRVALWLLVPILVMKTVIGFNLSGLNPFVSAAEILQTVDGVRLDLFSREAATAVIESSAAWGIAQLALCLFVWLILLRYRAGLPAAILVLLIEQIGRTGHGLVRIGVDMVAGSKLPAAGGLINLGMAIALVAAFVISLVARRPIGSTP
jgi:hypothetical protein